MCLFLSETTFESLVRHWTPFVWPCRSARRSSQGFFGQNVGVGSKPENPAASKCRPLFTPNNGHYRDTSVCPFGTAKRSYARWAMSAKCHQEWTCSHAATLRGTTGLALRIWTTSPRWFIVRLRRTIVPRSGRERDGEISTTSLSPPSHW